MSDAQLQAVLQFITRGPVLAFISIIFVLAIGCIILLVKFISIYIRDNISEFEHGKTKVKFNNKLPQNKIVDTVKSKSENENTTLSNTNIPISLSLETFNLLLDTIENIYQTFIFNRDKINKRLETQQLKVQNDALLGAILNLQSLYTSSAENKEEDKEDSEVLELYLTRDFHTIVKKEINELLQTDDIYLMNNAQITEQTTNISERCIAQMKNAINQYPIIDTILMRSIFDSQTPNIKNMILSIITKLSKSSTEQRQQILEIQEEKMRKLREKLEIILGSKQKQL